ncbi:MAG TPA: ATP-binding cassette domain-containing protein [Candidatus Cloacimonetes bacterium]|nr:ATP-binding cassette domain-containing protein [Candidatus Cloacimonadota bacterium]HEX37857.1 ATP-binding cassette domain-containing protein [Candidatus Cloacimonadota bacterium]
MQSKSNNSLIKVRQLTKRFDKLIAVNDISFEVFKGELFGFLGPNGAGKTTTINMLTGLARPDSGSIEISGLDCSKNPKLAQHLIGIVPDESNLYPELTGYDNLCFCASLYGMRKHEREERARDLLEKFGLSDAANRKFAGYSKGMKRKLTIAAGIIHRPEILFLDEPTTGIDVASARQIRQLIANLHDSGTTIFLTTHYIEEAERLCQRIGFIVQGKIVRIDTVISLLQPIQKKHTMVISVLHPDEGLHHKLISEFPEYSIELVSKGQFRIVSEKVINIGPLVRCIEETGGEVSEARRIRPSLEEVFVNITGIELNAMKKEKQKNGRSS